MTRLIDRAPVSARAAAPLVIAAMIGCGLGGPSRQNGDDDDDGGGGASTSSSSSSDGSGAGSASASSTAATSSASGGPSTCAVPAVPSSGRPVELLPAGELAGYVERLPCIADGELVAILESPDTMLYTHASIIPGYQDSYGNGIDFPVGMRPNTIDPIVIELAVPGGHGQLFESIGAFHFPFGNPIQVAPGDALVVDFWHVPRDAAGELLPVVWWWYEPSGWTHRIKWSFPVGTVFGELMYVVDGNGQLLPFEIRTRRREIDRWVVDAHRPFPEASDLAAALSALGHDATAEAVLSPETLQPAGLSASHYSESFPATQGAQDMLPALPADVVTSLLLEQPFTSAKGKAWKQHGELTAYAPTSDAALSIVPRGYNAGLVPVTDESCTNCHKDAGRPFKDYYFNVTAYGELWGEDENFTWHPFEASAFVNASGDVVSFNDDNRVMRSDFIAGGVLAEYDPGQHPASIYAEIDRPWRNYVHQ